MQKQTHNIKREAGFTLLEILIVMVVIALIASLAITQLGGVTGRAKTDTAKLQLEQLANAVEFFQMDVGRYPTGDEGLSALVAAPASVTNWRGPYLKKASAITDPWGTPVQYDAPGTTRAFDLISLGSDGAEGGAGEAADIDYWEIP